MSIADTIVRLSTEYEARFGEAPDWQWYKGDADAFIALIQKALDTGVPIPEFTVAHGLPPEALT